jgi:hypothetical protein
MRRSFSLLTVCLLVFSICFALKASAAPCKHKARQARDDSSTRFEKVNRTALGFHNVAAPVGARIALSENYALDVGVGFSSQDNRDDWAFDGGLPITLKGWRGARALFRPGVLYEKEDLGYGDRRTTTLSAELEGEAFLVKDLSVSAAFGVAHRSVDQPGAGDKTESRSTGGEFTNVGFHLYLFR